ncbi:hypothetical protein KL86PLE_90315 [uncultured Pleomorphomonas sp.]|uniref:Uncharacterized protein n=1 Tax=uncultured Pleomorphomonas sp. TaxID=442121 RepID=A0A212LNY6_9HYPH|nr:hypothetical protein KL86PLE_90315 [uncultured Pleomorphomonas sp.]
MAGPCLSYHAPEAGGTGRLTAMDSAFFRKPNAVSEAGAATARLGGPDAPDADAVFSSEARGHREHDGRAGRRHRRIGKRAAGAGR